MAETKMGLYKGKKYRVKFVGPTKFGQRAHLEFLDGSKSFWAAAELVQLLREGEEGSQKGGTGGASEKQLAALAKMLRKLEKVGMFDSFSGNGAEAADGIREKIAKLGGKDKLTSRQASELIQEVSGYLDDEM